MDVFETDRLVLRHQTAEDAPFLLALMNDPEWLLHIGDRGVRTVADARAYILNGAVAMYERYGFGLYLIERKDGRVPVGLCGLLRRDTLDHVDLGYAVAAAYRGLGYAREATAATVAYARDVVELDRLAALVSPGNDVSIRLLNSLGFERTTESVAGDATHLYLLNL